MASGTITKQWQPSYQNSINLFQNPFPNFPTTSIQNNGSFTAPSDGVITIFADRATQGQTIYFYINDYLVCEYPAHVGGIAVTPIIPVRKGDTLTMKTDGNNSWILRSIFFVY